ncbi:MAG: ABC transporter ATP-binding protein [Sphaerochaeta sp.]
MMELRNVSKTFNPGTQDAKKALDNFSLNVRTGDFITIIGANGAGKSTLFNAICGNFIADSGSIIIDGEDVTFTPDHKRAKSIGRLFQDPLKGSAPNMSIEENLALAAGRGSWFSRVTKQDRADFRERLSLLGMGLEDRLRQPVGLLSGGQRQALTLMMATFNPPKLLLLDEHTAALDPGTAEKVLELTLKIVKKDSITCMMITHNMQSAIDMGNRLLMMNHGRLILDTEGSSKSALTVSALVEMFRLKAGRALQTDRMLLSERD